MACLRGETNSIKFSSLRRTNWLQVRPFSGQKVMVEHFLSYRCLPTTFSLLPLTRWYLLHTSDAWMLLAHVVRCLVKFYNEWNPCFVLVRHAPKKNEVCNRSKSLSLLVQSQFPLIRLKLYLSSVFFFF